MKSSQSVPASRAGRSCNPAATSSGSSKAEPVESGPGARVPGAARSSRSHSLTAPRQIRVKEAHQPGVAAGRPPTPPAAPGADWAAGRIRVQAFTDTRGREPGPATPGQLPPRSQGLPGPGSDNRRPGAGGSPGPQRAASTTACGPDLGRRQLGGRGLPVRARPPGRRAAAARQVPRVILAHGTWRGGVRPPAVPPRSCRPRPGHRRPRAGAAPAR